MDAPRRLALTLFVAALSTLSACSQQRPIHVIRAAAEAAYDKGDYDLARAEYEQLVERYPGDPTRDEVIDAYCVALYVAKEQDTLMTFLRRLSLERGQINDFLPNFTNNRS